MTPYEPNDVSTDDRLMIDYLLGRLPPLERERLEERFFADDAFADRLLEHEDDLLDELAAGTLNSPDERALLDRQMSTPEGARRAVFARALHEWRVRHPLVEAAMTKDDIRRYSHELALPTWDKPSSPCLSSRFPYGTAIDLEKLKKVGACEVFLKGLGFREFRVRYHGDLARIEVNPNEIDRLFDKTIRDTIVKRFKEVGFSFVSLDLQGFRSGSLNEGLYAPAL